MRILLHGEQDLELREMEEPELSVEAVGEGAYFSALQMFAASLALCTYSVLASYAQRINAGTGGMRMRVRWNYADNPYRVADIDLAVEWPELPESRLEAAERAANHCTLHHTLAHPPAVRTTVAR